MKNLISLIIGLGLFLLYSTVSYAAIAKIQDKATVVVSNTASVTFSSPVTAGDFIGVCVRSGSSAINTISDNLGNTYLPTTPGFQPSGLSFWYVKSALAGTPTITINATASGSFLGMTAAEFSGLGISPTQDGNFATSPYGSAATIQTNIVSTSGGNPELLLGCGYTDSAQTPSGLVDYGAGGGTPSAFTNQGQISGSLSETLVGGWQSVVTSGPFGFQWTITTSNGAGAIVAFKPGNPALNSQSICPQNGPCFYSPDTVSNYLTAYKCNTGVTCQGVIVDAPAACTYNTKLTSVGGGGNFRCDVVYDQNQGAWIED